MTITVLWYMAPCSIEELNRRFRVNIFINSLYATLFYTKNLCFIEEHYMLRHISAIIRCYQFSIYDAKHIKKLCLKVTQHIYVLHVLQ
jgi:hypothetical protein